MIWMFSLFMSCLASTKSTFFIISWLSVQNDSLSLMGLTFFNFLMMTALKYFSENSGLTLKLNMTLSSILLLVGFSFFCKSPLLFLIMLEFSVMPTALMILVLSKDEDKLLSVLMMLMINLGGSLPFIFFSVWFLYTFDESWVLCTLGCDSLVVMLMYLLVLCSKLPIAMFHFWLTKAHVAASACVSMILASLLLKLGSFGLMKYSSSFSSVSFKTLESFLSWSVFFCLLFSLNMVRFVDMKMLVALSSILHMGMMLPLISQDCSMGNLSMIFMMLGHGLVSYFLFLIVSIMYENSLSRSSHYNKSSESLFGGMSLVLFSFSFLNMGVPPFINFLSETGICSWLMIYSIYSIFPFFLCMILTIFFCMYLVSKSIFGRKLTSTNQESEYSLPMFTWICIMVLLIYPLYC